MKAHIQVQSELDNGEVGKLSYRARRAFQIIKDLESNSYHVKRYNDDNAEVRKYKGTDLYLLPLAIFSCDPLDTMDVRYLNYSNTPVISPLKKTIKQRCIMIHILTNNLRHSLHQRHVRKFTQTTGKSFMRNVSNLGQHNQRLGVIHLKNLQ